MNTLFYTFLGKKIEAKNAWKYGFNKWDEEWESGAYDEQGEKTTWINAIRSVNAIKVVPNTGYYFKSPSTRIYACWYQADGTFINRATVNANNVATSPANAGLLRFCTNNDYGTTYNHDICINVSGEHNGEYVPYNG